MHPVEIREVLDSMTILVDRREQPTLRAKKRYKRFGCPYERATLNYGDYAVNARLPNGKWIYDVSDTVRPLASVERKMNLDELAGCFCQGRERFEREFQRAADNGARIYLLVEGGSWGALQLHGYRSRMNPNAFMASVIAYMVRYNMNLIFCDEASSARLIREILYRDLKERLERGDFDG
ncbi:MAG: ERCC4 domain-containing protein [Lachnospiraceae bacterium]|nr:ERCC4 domain-containing protein [Lachnospiraceae bacterium]